MSTERLQEIEKRMTRSEELLDELEARMEKAHEYCENCDYTENDKECVKRFRTRLVALEAVLEAAQPIAKYLQSFNRSEFKIEDRDKLINAVEAAEEAK